MVAPTWLFDVVTNDRDVPSNFGPFRRTGDEHGQRGVDEGNTSVDCALCVELRGLFRTNGQVADEDVNLSSFSAATTSTGWSSDSVTISGGSTCRGSSRV